jgi:4-amino-4-deoxy-L-arabinose transferase-like glycosyltransferase
MGLPGLVPLLLGGVAGALVFAVARRLTDPTVALLTWFLWATSAACLLWRASYFSQNSSTAVWLLSVWALLSWKAHGRTYQLVAVLGSLAWIFLTRPLTAMALGVPIVLSILVIARQRQLIRQVVFSTAIVIPVLFLNLLWQDRTLGSWMTSPYAEYSRAYFPFVKPGFGVDPTPPLRRNAPEIAWLGQQFVGLHAAHQFQALPAILLQRTFAVLAALGRGWRGFLVVLFALGAWRVRGPGRFALFSVGCLLAGYLIYAHPAQWAVYYAEVFPVFFFIASLELIRLGRVELKLAPGQLRSATLFVMLLLLPMTVSDVLEARRVNDERSNFHRVAAAALASISRDEPAVVFVRYPETHNHHLSLVANTPDFQKARLWVVHDRGAANERLLRLTDRAAYRLSTENWTVERLR